MRAGLNVFVPKAEMPTLLPRNHIHHIPDAGMAVRILLFHYFAFQMIPAAFEILIVFCYDDAAATDTVLYHTQWIATDLMDLCSILNWQMESQKNDFQNSEEKKNM